MKTKMNEVIVVKIGGSHFGRLQPTVLDVGDVEDIVELQRRGKPLIIVHGGGHLITEWLNMQHWPDMNQQKKQALSMRKH